MAPGEHLDEHLDPCAVIPLQLAAAGRYHISSLRYPGGANTAEECGIMQGECEAAHSGADHTDAAVPRIVQCESFGLLTALCLACRG